MNWAMILYEWWGGIRRPYWLYVYYWKKQWKNFIVMPTTCKIYISRALWNYWFEFTAVEMDANMHIVPLLHLRRMIVETNICHQIQMHECRRKNRDPLCLLFLCTFETLGHCLFLSSGLVRTHLLTQEYLIEILEPYTTEFTFTQVKLHHDICIQARKSDLTDLKDD